MKVQRSVRVSGVTHLVVAPFMTHDVTKCGMDFTRKESSLFAPTGYVTLDSTDCMACIVSGGDL